MKWIGQHIWDLISRFRSTVYFENLETSSETNVLVVDSDGKVTKNSAAAGDITEVVAGSGLTGGGASGSVTLNVGAGTGIDVAADAISVDVSDFLTGGDGGNDHRFAFATGTDSFTAYSNLTYTDPGYGYSFITWTNVSSASTVMFKQTQYGNLTIEANDHRASDHEADITLDADGSIFIESYYSTTIDSKQDITLDAEGEDITLKSDNNERIHFKLDSTPTMEVTGHFDIDASASITLDSATGEIDFKSGSSQLANISSAGLSFVDNTGAGIIFEGTTDDAYNTTLTAADTTSSSKTITLPDATGTVALTSDIPDETTANNETFALKTVKVTITRAQFNSLHTTPIDLVGAPGANKQIVPISGTIAVDRLTTQANGLADLNVHYDLGGSVGSYFLNSYMHVRRFMWNKGTDITYNLSPFSLEIAQSKTAFQNKKLQVSVDSILQDSGGAQNCIGDSDIYVSYYILDMS